MVPPASPPAACSIAQPTVPPGIGATMKNVAIMIPAMAPESVDAAIAVTSVAFGFWKTFLCCASLAVTS